MGLRAVVFGVLLLLLGSLSAWGQKQQHKNRRFPTLEEQLQQHGIALTKASLLSALHNPDVLVRYDAALKLAQDGQKDAVPAITEALVSEKQEQAIVNFAFALAQLGDQKGREALRDACSNRDVSNPVRMDAARLLLTLQDESCLSSVLDVLDSPNVAGRSQAMYLLPEFRTLSKADSDRSLNLLVKALNDPSASIRIIASDVLGKLGKTAAIPYLEAAVAAEQDDDVRSQMQTDLRSLQVKQSH